MQAGARVVLAGITPGPTQAKAALRSLREGLLAGLSDADALARAQAVASFSGALRDNLVAMLDHVGLQNALSLRSSADLFHPASTLAHFTSVLRYPVFRGGTPHSGNPKILRTPGLRSQVDVWFSDELAMLPNAYWIPLGAEPTNVLRYLVGSGHLRADRLLDEMIHPSPASAERILYFLGRKPRAGLSIKTNPEVTDGKVARLRAKIAGVGANAVSAPPAAAGPRVPAEPAAPAAARPAAPAA